MSFLACPIWALASLMRIAYRSPPGAVALARVAIPIVTLAIVLANSALQRKIARANAERVVAACERFHADNGTFPRTLKELVPVVHDARPAGEVLHFI